MSKIIAKWALGLALAVQTVGAFSAVTGMTFVSSSGDYIGQGLTQTYVPPTATLTATAGSNTVSLQVSDPGNSWQLVFAAPSGSAIARGSYANAARYPINSPLGAGLDMEGDGRGCNTLKGWFRVREYEVTNGVVSKLAIDFVQNCEVTMPPLYGAVRINSSYPLVAPETAAVAGADFAVVAGHAATLDGTQSFSRDHSPLTYHWVQVDGPAVTLNHPRSAAPSFVAPDVGATTGNLRFRLDVTDAAGTTAHDFVGVVVESATAPRTQASFRGDAGDWITQGKSYSYDSYNAVIGFSRNYDGGVSASVSGDTWWYFDTAAPTGTPFGPGTYTNAQRFPFQTGTSPGLDLYGDGRGCNTLTGSFTVYQATFDASGAPQVLDISFEQHCEGGSAAAYGEFLLNAVPHATLASQLRQLRARYPAE